MSFSDSYLGQLRRHVGHALLLCPGAQVVVQRPDGTVLLQRRTDNGLWELPAGAAEPGQSFADVAVAELAQETGIRTTPGQLEPFACLSEPDLHTIRYPNGDQVHAFGMCYLLRVDHVTTGTGDGEATDHSWHDPGQPPEPLYGPTRIVLQLLDRYLNTGRFQSR